MGDLGQIFAITYHPLPESYRTVPDTPESENQKSARDKFYSGLLHDFYFPEYFKRATTKADIESESFIGDDAERALWATISLPEIYPIKGTKKILDGKRCVLKTESVWPVMQEYPILGSPDWFYFQKVRPIAILEIGRAHV